MEYQLIYRACANGRDIQKNLNGKETLMSYLKSFTTEPIYRETVIVSVHEIRKTGPYGNGRKAKKLDVAKLIGEVGK